MEDDVKLGASGCELVIKGQKFGTVEKQETIFHEGFEAIIGMGYPEHAEDGVASMLEQIIGQKMLQQNIFAFYLGS